MAYKHNLQCWTADGPPLVAAGSNLIYRAKEKRIVRIIPASDMYIVLSDDAAVAIADAATGALLKANQEYFIDMGDYKFLSASLNTGNVIVLKQEGMARY